MLNLIELEHDDIIHFEAKTSNYGRAEFTFCTLWKSGTLTDAWLTPKQQPNAKYVYHVGNLACDSFQTYSWTHLGFDNPWAWLYGWCDKHKCPFMHVYVPINTRLSKLRVSVLSTLSFVFED